LAGGSRVRAIPGMGKASLARIKEAVLG